MISILTLFLILASGTCFFISLAVPHVALVFCGGIFVLYCSIAFHELGHLIACLFKKRKVAALYLYPIKIEQNRIKLTKTFKFCVLFYKGEKEGLIHLFGPIFTLIQLLCAIILSICIPNTHTTVFLAASIVMLFGCGKDLFRTFHKHSQKD